MRRVIYRVAVSVDGYIAGPHGELDWITGDESAAGELAALYESVDTVLLGRRTYELTKQPGAPPWPRDWKIYVFSRTLSPDRDSRVTVIGTNVEKVVGDMRAAQGKDIWLFGGGSLFKSLLDAKLVDGVEIAVMPVVLGGGVPLLEPGAQLTRLALTRSKSYPGGIVSLRYEMR